MQYLRMSGRIATTTKMWKTSMNKLVRDFNSKVGMRKGECALPKENNQK